MDLGARGSQSGNKANVTLSGYNVNGVRALVLVGGRADTERFGDMPLALLDVLGRSVLLRMLDRLRAAGIADISVLSDTDPLSSQPPSATCKFNVAKPEDFWEEALHLFRQLSRHSESVLVVRLGAWAELDVAAMIEQHRHSGVSIMRACTRQGAALDIFAISSSSQSEAAALLRGEMLDRRLPMLLHLTDGYVNMLTAPASLRTLTLDAFACESEIRPCGQELRPGIWMGKGARVHRRARIVAPAFIGNYCYVHRAAVITRGSSVEHHSEVDCATMVDNSSVLPHTRIGAGLDVEYSVVGFKKVHSTQRNVTVEIEDPRLIGVTASNLSARVFAAGVWVFNCLPGIIWEALFANSTPLPADVPEALVPRAPALSDSSMAPVESKAKPYREMVTTRRYGNE